MKSTVLYALLLLLPASLNAAEQITVEAKFIESNNGAIPHDLTKLSEIKGIDLLSAPRATIKSGEQAQIDVVREHQPASVAPSSFSPVPIGVSVLVTPHLKADRIAYTAQLTISELITQKAPAGQKLSEITSRILYVSGTPKDGEEVWFDFGPGTYQKIVQEPGKPDRTDTIRTNLSALLTFHRDDDSSSPAPKDAE